MLEHAFNTFRETGNRKDLLETVKSCFKIKKVDKDVEAYIVGDTHIEKGSMFNVQPFEGNCTSRFTYRELFGRYDDTVFPAMVVGGDGSGVEFWLVLTTGKVISLHHDATFLEMAADIEAETPKDFIKKFSHEGSTFKFENLLRLQQECLSIDPDATDFPIRFVHAVCQSLNWKPAKLNKHIQRRNLEFVYTPIADFVENNGLADLAAAEKKMDRFHKALDNKKATAIDLSYCFLEAVPKDLSELSGLKELDLGGNTLTDGLDQLQSLEQLEKLVLCGCDLSSLPKPPPNLRHLDISENDISDVSHLLHLSQLKYLNLNGLDIREETLEKLKKNFSYCYLDIKGKEIDYTAASLDLSCRNLRKLPTYIDGFSNLEQLNLKGNPKLKFCEIFTQLSQFPGLKVLHLEACKLLEIPPELTDLKNIEELYLGHDVYQFDKEIRNDLDIAETIKLLAAFPKLKKFSVTGLIGSLKLFNQNLPQLSNLVSVTPIFEHYFRDQEALDDFFRILSQFPHLEELRFCDISLEEMDLSGLSDLGRLRTLIWRGHGEPRKEFPGAVCKLKNLERLDISAPGFEKIPPSISDLKQLRILRCTESRTRSPLSLPNTFGELTAMEELVIRGKYLDKLPQSVGKLKELKRLDVGDNYYLKALPAEIGELTNLEVLKADHNSLELLPDAIGSLTKLQELAVNNNNITELPECIGNLEKLRKLDFQFCNKLKRLPDSFAQLANLETLHLNNKCLDYDDALQKIIHL
ncbi:MAG: leucine-rich repeat domain-containing protein, partial [bacterium]|nr:leucine-rich repeat domain-containing protein [bacterium]